MMSPGQFGVTDCSSRTNAIGNTSDEDERRERIAARCLDGACPFIATFSRLKPQRQRLNNLVCHLTLTAGRFGRPAALSSVLSLVHLRHDYVDAARDTAAANAYPQRTAAAPRAVEQPVHVPHMPAVSPCDSSRVDDVE